MICKAYVTHQKGSWRWQDRYALVLYRPRKRKKDGRMVWASHQVLDDKVKPSAVRGHVVGSLHNQLLSTEDCAILALYGDETT